MTGELAPQRPQPGLLRLPPTIRHRIYDFVDLVRDPSYTLAFDLNRISNTTPLGFYGLLLSCRIIYEEASRLLYSSNHFAVRYSDRGSLHCLRNLRSNSINALRHLKIVLAETSCHLPVDQRGRECCTRPSFQHPKFIAPMNWCKKHHCHDSPLDSSADALLADWDLTAAHLASATSPGMLALAIVCDVCPSDAGMQVAMAATASLLRLSELRDCSLRLCKTPDPNLQELAYNTVLRARKRLPLPSSTTSLQHPNSTAPKSSPWITLPRELRLQILEYTDLVTPWTEVTWCRQQKGFSCTWTYCEDMVGEGYDCPPSRHYGCQFHQCWETSLEQPTTGCFCRVVHSAYSSSQSCRCWQPPQSLFLICRTIYRDAKAIFFSRNRFIIHDLHAYPPYEVPDETSIGPGYPFPKFSASIFLKSIIPSHCISYLRSLELVFPPYNAENWPQEGHPALKDWADTLDWARDRLNVSGLTIRVVMADVNGYDTWPRDFIAKGEGGQIIAGYMSIISNLARLGPLDRFYAQLVSPWKWDRRTSVDERLAGSKDKELKERAEKLIMRDRYESPSSGPAEPSPSIWQHVYWAKW